MLPQIVHQTSSKSTYSPSSSEKTFLVGSEGCGWSARSSRKVSRRFPKPKKRSRPSNMEKPKLSRTKKPARSDMRRQPRICMEEGVSVLSYS